MNSNTPHFPKQNEIDDLVIDLGLTKAKAKLLTSRLKEWNLLDPTCKVCTSRKRHVTFAIFFLYLNIFAIVLTYVRVLFQEIGIDYFVSNKRFVCYR